MRSSLRGQLSVLVLVTCFTETVLPYRYKRGSETLRGLMLADCEVCCPAGLEPRLNESGPIILCRTPALFGGSGGAGG